MAAVMQDLSQDDSWSIVFVSFMAQLLAYGSPQAVGVLYPEWLNTFQEGKSTTAWVGSTALGVGLIA
ncbi:monocarboxylate transporter 9a isoform X1, partial [Tachysurus ichikawai]